MLEKEVKNDPRSKRTRRLLQEALTDLMRKQKFHEISVQDITARAEINRATFYAHFVDKYELLNSQIRDSFQSLLDQKLPEHPDLHHRQFAYPRHECPSIFSGFCRALCHCRP